MQVSDLKEYACFLLKYLVSHPIDHYSAFLRRYASELRTYIEETVDTLTIIQKYMLLMEVYYTLPERVPDVESVRESLLSEIRVVNPEQFSCLIEGLDKRQMECFPPL